MSCTHSLAQHKGWASARRRPASLKRIRNPSCVASTSKQSCIFPPYQQLLWSADHVRLRTSLPEIYKNNRVCCFHTDVKSLEKVEHLRSNKISLINPSFMLAQTRPSKQNKKSLWCSFPYQANDHVPPKEQLLLLVQALDFSTRNLFLLSCQGFEISEKKVEQNLSVDQQLMPFASWVSNLLGVKKKAKYSIL